MINKISFSQRLIDIASYSIEQEPTRSFNVGWNGEHEENAQIYYLNELGDKFDASHTVQLEGNHQEGKIWLKPKHCP